LNPTKAESRINVATLGVFLEPVYQRMQNSTEQAIQHHVCWKGGIFTSGALELIWSLTGQQIKESAGCLGYLRAARCAFLMANSTNLTFFRDSWCKKNCFFSTFGFLGAVSTNHQTGIFTF